MGLDNLKPARGSRRNPKRVGRGPGSGTGRTAGRGDKGQKSRSGYSRKAGFEGGQMPLYRRVPKRGFHNRSRVVFRVVNVGALAAFGEGASVDAAALEQRGLIRHGKAPVKLLAEGDAPAKLTVKVQKASAAARRKIEEAGGSLELG